MARQRHNGKLRIPQALKQILEEKGKKQWIAICLIVSAIVALAMVYNAFTSLPTPPSPTQVEGLIGPPSFPLPFEYPFAESWNHTNETDTRLAANSLKISASSRQQIDQNSQTLRREFPRIRMIMHNTAHFVHSVSSRFCADLSDESAQTDTDALVHEKLMKLLVTEASSAADSLALALQALNRKHGLLVGEYQALQGEAKDCSSQHSHKVRDRDGNNRKCNDNEVLRYELARILTEVEAARSALLQTQEIWRKASGRQRTFNHEEHTHARNGALSIDEEWVEMCRGLRETGFIEDIRVVHAWDPELSD